MNKNLDLKEYHYKIIIIGDSGVGKSSILARYSNKSFNEFLKPTIGFDYFNKKISKDNYNINWNIFDSAGQENFHSIGSSLYHGAHAIILVYDLTNKSTFFNLNTWLNKIENYLDFNNIKIILIGNKKDMYHKIKVKKEEVEEFYKKNNLYYLETSAKEELVEGNIEKIFEYLVRELNKISIKKDKPIEKGKVYDINDIKLNMNSTFGNCCSR